MSTRYSTGLSPQSLHLEAGVAGYCGFVRDFLGSMIRFYVGLFALLNPHTCASAVPAVRGAITQERRCAVATIDITGFLADAREKAKGGLTAQEAASLMLRLVRMLMAMMETIDAPGASKKQAVLDGASQMWDALVPFLPVPWYARPFWVLFQPAAKGAAMAAISSLIELWLPDLRAHGDAQKGTQP